jgi:hypothetical protein
MDFTNEILAEHSKKQTLKIVDFIGKDQSKFNEFIQLLFSNSEVIAQRASWVISHCCQKNSQLIIPHLAKIIKVLKKPVHNAVKRNALRILQDIDMPPKLRGEVTNTCFQLVGSQSSAVAIKAFSISILYKICLSEPDLMKELKIVIEDQMPYSSPAFTSRGRKILNQINKKGLN